MKKLFQAMKNEPFKTFVVVAAVVALLLLANIARDVDSLRARVAPKFWERGLYD